MKAQKTKILLAAVGMSGMLFFGMPVEASEGLAIGCEENIMPQYDNSYNLDISFVFSGGKAKCVGKLVGKTGTDCSITATLQKKSGSGWTNVKTWKSAGTKVSGSQSISKGSTYRLKVVGKKGTESITRHSGSKTY